MCSKITCLRDLNSLRTAPSLDLLERNRLICELNTLVCNSDWLTIGIMADSSKNAISVLRQLEQYYNFKKMININNINPDGPVYLKANQNTGQFYIRLEYGLGQGILLSCQYISENLQSDTVGPLPLDFFSTNT